MADLRVELYGRLVGHLVGTSSRTFDFRTDRFAELLPEEAASSATSPRERGSGRPTSRPPRRSS